MLQNDDSPVPIASFIPTKAMDAIPDKGRVYILGTTFMAIHAPKDEAVAAEASIGQEAPAHKSSKSSSEESNHHCMSQRGRYLKRGPQP